MSARPFTDNEIALLESHLISTGHLRNRMLLVFLCNVGFRVSEALTCRVGQVLTRDGDIASEVTVARAFMKGGAGVHRKSVRSRRVVLNSSVRAAIRDYISNLDHVPTPGEFLFRSREGDNQPLHRSQVHRLLKGMCNTCGIDATRISCHSGRKWFLRSLFEASGHNLLATMLAAGHRSCLTTQAYLPQNQEEVDQLVIAIGARKPLSSVPSSATLKQGA